uniref:Ferric reductase NAD binding domain-containing protein n=1 Tax=Odontella aurita TaxID=265563 RepID=A0A7S4NI13_9STRA|mmetsp:Transcript_7124/g.21248  ORF Transcript_7124/g.21248 Transcript_7124/m.21248 type:complete len:618 (+) Transcript_7124:30-1883(+)
MSAFSLYPTMILVFLTKCKALHNILVKTPLSMFLILNDSHELHNYAGRFIAVDVWIHTLFHILRWVDQRNVSLLWSHQSGLSGLIVVALVPFIALPMVLWKQKISYEMRKGLHYLFILFAVGLCFHVPMSAIPNGGFIAPAMGFCIFLYAADASYVYLFMTEKIETTTFHVLSSGVRITMPVSETFQKSSEKGGFAFVCLPWVDKLQWHAFSLFEDPSDPSKRQMFMLKTGDWTTAVHKALQRDTVRPVWIQGPFLSPYNYAEMYDNQVLVATGIGITPALSVIRAHKSSRRINLVWAVRDPSMLEFFLEHLYLDHDGWNLIFYTGKEPLLPALEELNTNVRVIKGRPDLKTVVPNIIYGIESGVGLPEKCTPSSMVHIKELLIEKMRELDEVDGISSNSKVAALTTFANSHGFLFTDIINEMKEENVKRNSSRFLTGSEPSREGLSTKDTIWGEGSSNADDNAGASAVLRQLREFGRVYSRTEEEDEEHSCEGIESAPLINHSSRVDRSEWQQSLGETRESCSVSNDRRMRHMWTSIRQSFTPCMSDQNVVKALTSTFKPWEKTDKAEYFVKGLDREHVLPTWGLLYCGGSPPVQKTLKEISAEYHISLNIDSFSW